MRGDTIASLADEIRHCRLCEAQGLIPEARPIFQLPETARIGLFSQAPGNLAHQKGKPFYDPSGVRLRDWMGVTEDEFYTSGRIAIIPMAFCFPGYDGKSPTGKGGDLPPPKLCAETWRKRVMAQIEEQLRLVLLVGGYSQKWHLGDKMGRTLTETVGKWRSHIADARKAGRPVYLPLPHPSWRNNGWLKKNLWFEAEVVPFIRSEIREAFAD